MNQTGQGLLKYSGINNQSIEMRLQQKALNKRFSRYSISITKCLWKLIAANVVTAGGDIVLNNCVHAMIEAVSSSPRDKFLSSNYDLTSCYLILNDEILYIVDKNEDMLLHAFYISEIDIKMSSRNNNASSNNVVSDENSSNSRFEASSSLCITLNQLRIDLSSSVASLDKNPSDYNHIYENTMDRLVDYVLHLNSNKSNTCDSDLNHNNEDGHVLFD